MAIVYLTEDLDAPQETRRLIEKEGRRCLTIAGDVGTVLCLFLAWEDKCSIQMAAP